MDSSREEADQTPDLTPDSANQGFNHTHIFYIAPHSRSTSEIKIHDITNAITAPYPSEEFKAASEAEGQARSDSVPEWIVHDYGIWTTPTVHTGTTTASTKSEDNLIATWKPSKGQYGKNTYIFPSGSVHSEHNVILEKEKKWVSYDEVFVVHSVQYFWRYDGHSRRKFTLWKVTGQNKLVVARYKGKMRVGKRGGTIIINSNEVDCVVAILTMMGMLRKVKQRG